MSTLHVWHNEYDWVVAESAAQAVELHHEHSGCTVDEIGDFEMWADDRTLTINDDDGPAQTKTCAEWATASGPGFLCSTNW